MLEAIIVNARHERLRHRSDDAGVFFIGHMDRVQIYAVYVNYAVDTCMRTTYLT